MLNPTSIQEASLYDLDTGWLTTEHIGGTLTTHFEGIEVPTGDGTYFIVFDIGGFDRANGSIGPGSYFRLGHTVNGSTFNHTSWSHEFNPTTATYTGTVSSTTNVYVKNGPWRATYDTQTTKLPNGEAAIPVIGTSGKFTSTLSFTTINISSNVCISYRLRIIHVDKAREVFAP